MKASARFPQKCLSSSEPAASRPDDDPGERGGSPAGPLEERSLAPPRAGSLTAASERLPRSYSPVVMHYHIMGEERSACVQGEQMPNANAASNDKWSNAKRHTVKQQ